MKKLTIEIEADDEMSTGEFKITNDGFSNVEYSYAIYRLLLHLFELKGEDILISVDTFMDAMKERGIL